VSRLNSLSLMNHSTTVLHPSKHDLHRVKASEDFLKQAITTVSLYYIILLFHVSFGSFIHPLHLIASNYILKSAISPAFPKAKFFFFPPGISFYSLSLYRKSFFIHLYLVLGSCSVSLMLSSLSFIWINAEFDSTVEVSESQHTKLIKKMSVNYINFIQHISWMLLSLYSQR